MVQDLTIRLRRLIAVDVRAHCDGEDAESVRWLTGEYGTATSTLAHFEQLALNADAGRGKRGFGVCLGDRLAGYVDGDPDDPDGLAEGEVNISYATHPWARGRGVATAAVGLMCEYIRTQGIGSAAVLRVERENHPSLRVCGEGGVPFCARIRVIDRPRCRWIARHLSLVPPRSLNPPPGGSLIDELRATAAQ